MKRIKNDRGITLISLIILLTVMAILVSVSISAVVINQKETKIDTFKSELIMVKNAALQRKTLIDTTSTDYEELPGTEISKKEVEKVVRKKNITLKGNDGDYKLLNSGELEKLGITNTEDEYIVNYQTGEVINKDKFDMFDEALYIYSVEESE